MTDKADNVFKRLASFIFLAATLPAFSISAAVASDATFVTIGTGGVTGIYYPIGGAICRLVNKGRKQHGIRCSVESTGGSIYNLNTIKAGELDMGLAQSDWQHHAYHGTGKFEKQGANPDLRSVFSVHTELFTVLARADAGITHLQDLKGKRVNISNPGSGQRITMDVLLDALGWTVDDFRLASELKTAEQSGALCDNKVDAIALIIGHPGGPVKEATTTCEAVLVNVSGPAVDKLIADHSYYRAGTIPGGIYTGSDEDIETFGLAATFVTSAQVDEALIYTVVKSVFENFDSFKKFHPSFANLKKSEMIKEGLSAPLHAGAMRYYKEAGLLD